MSLCTLGKRFSGLKCALFPSGVDQISIPAWPEVNRFPGVLARAEC
jgi:hypothetical protein